MVSAYDPSSRPVSGGLAGTSLYQCAPGDAITACNRALQARLRRHEDSITRADNPPCPRAVLLPRPKISRGFRGGASTQTCCRSQEDPEDMAVEPSARWITSASPAPSGVAPDTIVAIVSITVAFLAVASQWRGREHRTDLAREDRAPERPSPLTRSCYRRSMATEDRLPPMRPPKQAAARSRNSRTEGRGGTIMRGLLQRVGRAVRQDAGQGGLWARAWPTQPRVNRSAAGVWTPGGRRAKPTPGASAPGGRRAKSASNPDPRHRADSSRAVGSRSNCRRHSSPSRPSGSHAARDPR